MKATLFRTRKLDLQSPQHSFHQRAFDEFWPAYKSWYQTKKPNAANPVLVKQAKSQLADVMPELMPIYDGFRELSSDCPVAANFLTGYQPPAYLVNCSQAVLTGNHPLLIRNYDLSPDLSENVITHSNFLDLKVMGTNECLWGLDDGINSAGLAASLTFGGSNKVGKGFGIPFIMRYVLETCETVKQAIIVLQRVPSHMAYNITLVDKQGDFATVMVAPNQNAIISKERCITNHQQRVTWAEQARFSKTVERKQCLDELLQKNSLDKSKLINAFLKEPLRSSNYAQQFGTVFTAIYEPIKGTMSYHWPDEASITVGFDNFIEQDKTVQLRESLDISSTADSSHISSDNSHNVSQSYKDCVSQDKTDSLTKLDSISLEIRESLITSLAYLPCYSEEQTNAVSKLKRLLKSDRCFTWIEYGTRLAAAA